MGNGVKVFRCGFNWPVTNRTTRASNSPKPCANFNSNCRALYEYDQYQVDGRIFGRKQKQVSSELD